MYDGNMDGTYFIPESAYFIPGEITDKQDTISYGPITIGKFPAYVKLKKMAKESHFTKEFSVSTNDILNINFRNICTALVATIY